MAKTRIVGIDFGLQRIGIAVSDESKLIATPLKTIQTGKKIEDTIAILTTELNKDQEQRKYTIEEIVVGMPLLMSGQSGLMADEVRHFVEQLKTKVTCPIVTWDERLTSVQADRTLRETTMTRRQRTKVMDTVSAAIILQNRLDHKRLQQDI